MIKRLTQTRRGVKSAIGNSYATQVVTTPIFYVNGPPHIGHLYTTLLTDTTKHWLKMNSNNGDCVRFVTGTDEHGSKVQKSVVHESNEPSVLHAKIYEYCTQISSQFSTMVNEFKVENDTFVRTTDSFHRRIVQCIWNELVKTDSIYMGEYNGWYCTSDECFQTDVSHVTDPVTGQQKVISNLSGHTCEWLTEKNYKFRLSKFKPMVIKWLTDNPQVISPIERQHEILGNLNRQEDDNFQDLSVSRSRDRVMWGIPVPNDDSQTIYVWLDALVNYITGSVHESDFAHSEKIEFEDLKRALSGSWPPKVQVIGKDILKFHAFYWPAFLIALDLPLPEKLIVHPYWTVDRVKMSKSLGNVLHPSQLVQDLLIKHRNTSETNNKNAKVLSEEDMREYLRYYLLREGNLRDDSNFSTTDFSDRVNELANTFGNLWMRMFNKRFVSQVPKTIANYRLYTGPEKQIISKIDNLKSVISQAYNTGDIKPAIIQVFSILHQSNELFDEAKPWLWLKQLNQKDISDDEKLKLQQQLDTLMYIVAEVLRCSALAMYPIVPNKMITLLKYFGVTDHSKVRFEDLKFGAVGSEITLTENSQVLFVKLETNK